MVIRNASHTGFTPSQLITWTNPTQPSSIPGAPLQHHLVRSQAMNAQQMEHIVRGRAKKGGPEFEEAQGRAQGVVATRRQGDGRGGHKKAG